MVLNQFLPVLKNTDYWYMTAEGKLIFDEIGESPIWDGNNSNGVPCKTDSYSYKIDYKTFSGNRHTSNGVVSLIR